MYDYLECESTDLDHAICKFKITMILILGAMNNILHKKKKTIVTYVILHGHLGREELDMIGATAGRVDQPAGDPTHQEIILDAKLNDRVEPLLATF